jgi:hypothetical protein
MQYMLVSPLSGAQDDVWAGVKWLSTIEDSTTLTVADTMTVGDTSYFQVVLADVYGNVVNSAKNSTFSRKLKFTSVDSTMTGDDTKVVQKYRGAFVTGSQYDGVSMYDSLSIKIDSSGADAANGYFAGAIGIVPASTNGGTDFELIVGDTKGIGATSSVTVYVKGGDADSVYLAEAGPDTIARGGMTPTMSATLLDAYGNPIIGGDVIFALTSGTAGEWVTANGVDTTVTGDSLVVETQAGGVATAVYKAATTGNMITLTAEGTDGTNNTNTVTYTVYTQVTDSAGVITVISPTDSLVPVFATAGTITADYKDADGVARVWAKIWRSELTLNAQNTFDESDPIEYEVAVDSTLGSSSDSVRVALTISDTVEIDTAVVISYQLYAVDTGDDTTMSAIGTYKVAPKRGKRNMLDDKVTGADVMRLVYLIAIPDIVPKTVDWLGLDLDHNGEFETADLLAELAIWKGSSTLLAGANPLEDATTKTSLSYEATDKSVANLAVNLESSHNLSFATVKIKYDTEKFVFGEVKTTDRLNGVTVVPGNDTENGILTIIMINMDGGQILQGTGTVLNIEVKAAGEKFDGTGEISLLTAEFEEGVSAEISREALSPKALLPKAFALGQNYPNPFNPSTTIAYDIPEGDNVQVQLKVYNMRGQLVRTLVNESKSEGSYQVQWDGTDNYGRRVSSSVYFYRIKAGEFSKTRKMVILK